MGEKESSKCLTHVSWLGVVDKEDKPKESSVFVLKEKVFRIKNKRQGINHHYLFFSALLSVHGPVAASPPPVVAIYAAQRSSGMSVKFAAV